MRSWFNRNNPEKQAPHSHTWIVGKLVHILLWPLRLVLRLFRGLLIVLAPIVLILALAGAGPTGRMNGILTALAMACMAVGIGYLTPRRR